MDRNLASSSVLDLNINCPFQAPTNSAQQTAALPFSRHISCKKINRLIVYPQVSAQDQGYQIN